MKWDMSLRLLWLVLQLSRFSFFRLAEWLLLKIMGGLQLVVRSELPLPSTANGIMIVIALGLQQVELWQSGISDLFYSCQCHDWTF